MTALASPPPLAAPPAPRRSVLSGLLCAFAVALTAALPVVLLIAVPRFIAVFDDFDAELPTLTKLIVATPALPAVAFCLLLIVGLIVKEALLIGRRSVTIPLNVAVILLALLTGLLLFVGLWLPIAKSQYQVF